MGTTVSMSPTSRPLSGVKIVEFAADGPVTFCGMMLADLGAEVLRIDKVNVARPPFLPDAEHDWQLENRPTLHLDLKQATGLAAARHLLSQADALIEGYRPGVMERLGLGPESVSRLNPRLVFGRATGWGQSGPYAQRPGHDLNFLCIAGALHGLGPAQGPPTIPLNLVADMGGGGMFLALGIVCGLWEARTSGKGPCIDAAMVDGVATLMTSVFSMAAQGHWHNQRFANIFDGGAPWYSVYETLDQKYVAIACVEPIFFQRFLMEMGLFERYAHRQYDRAEWPAMRDDLQRAFLQKTRDAWCNQLAAKDVCFSPVLSLAEAQQDLHMRHRQHGGPATPQQRPAPAPRFGEATRLHPPKATHRTGKEVFQAWGLDPASLDGSMSPRVIS